VGPREEEEAGVGSGGGSGDDVLRWLLLLLWVRLWLWVLELVAGGGWEEGGEEDELVGEDTLMCAEALRL
jgi:hypothetical protein